MLNPSRERATAAPKLVPVPSGGWQSGGAAIPGLVWTLIRTDFKAKYHGTLSGFVWALLKPLMMFLVLEAVFSVIFRSDPNYRLNLIIGLFLWNFFAEATTTAMTSLGAKGYLLTKARFPAWILVVTSISNAVITVAVFSVMIAGFLVTSGHAVSGAALLLFALYICGLAVAALGIGLGTSALFLRYRDLNQLWDVVIQAGFFVAPIIYPIGILPERFHYLLYLWAPTPFIQFSRSVLVDGVLPGPRAHVVLVAGITIILGAGTLIFRRFSPRAADTCSAGPQPC